MGGLMQLVAYGAMDIYLQGNLDINWTYGSKSKKTQFFYKKIKKPNYSKQSNSFSQFQFTKPKPEPNYIQVKEPKIKKSNMFTRAQKNYPQNIRDKINQMCKVKKYYNQLIEKYIGNPDKIKFYNKVKLIELAKPIVHTINKHKYLQTYTEYFVGNINIPAFYIANNNFISSTKKLSNLLVLHSFLITQLDIDQPIIKPELKNTICAISYETIGNEYFECETCATCFDCSNPQVNAWFKTYSKCAICKQPFKPVVKHVGGENQIYCELKKNAKNT